VAGDARGHRPADFGVQARGIRFHPSPLIVSAAAQIQAAPGVFPLMPVARKLSAWWRCRGSWRHLRGTVPILARALFTGVADLSADDQAAVPGNHAPR
jgi:hypothetical protein